MAQTRHTDENIKLILENLEQMFICAFHCLNESAFGALLVGMGQEALLLTMKLEEMRARWTNYIPLKEMEGFDYKSWEGKIRMWVDILSGKYLGEDIPAAYKQYEPSNAFLFDLYALVKEQGQQGSHYYDIDPSQDLYESIRAYINNVYRMMDVCSKSKDQVWKMEACNMASERLRQMLVDDIPSNKEYVCEPREEMTERIRLCFESLKKCSDTVNCCILALNRLQNAMKKLQQALNRIPLEKFERLAARCYTIYGEKRCQEAEDMVNECRSTWPMNRIEECAKDMKEQALKDLDTLTKGTKLKEYIDVENPQLWEGPSFGQYLYASRKKLDHNYIEEIYYNCSIIRQVNDILSTHAKGTALSTSIPDEDEYRRYAWDTLRKQIRNPKATWQHITPGEIEKAMGLALGIEPGLEDARSFKMRNTLWKMMLTRREKSMIEDSVRLLWLKLLGYLIEHGYQKSVGTTLLHLFYPKAPDTEYNNINKGRDCVKDRPNCQRTFRSVIPLLDAAFKARKG